jgi:serine/threonine-protein kinase SRPK3
LVAKDREVKMTSFEELEKHLEGEDKEMFLDLMRGMITWRPEDRKTPKELIKHPWLQAMDTCFSQAN